MAMSVCPAATVAAPVEHVWALLTDPTAYERWIESGARVERVDPLGPVHPGQTIALSASALGVRWRLSLSVKSVEAERHRIRFRVSLPFGVVETTIITCTAQDERSCYVQYG